MKNSWWKYLSISLIFYSLIAGLIGKVPKLETGNLYQTIRNLYFHVPMWFAMSVLLLISVIYSIKYLYSSESKFDHIASATAFTGVWFGALGLITGAVWAKFTWGQAWHGDPKQNFAAIAMLVYLAYFVLRGALEDPEKSKRISSIYNIFAFAVFVPLVYILPRLTDSVHPGNGGNPGFNSYDLDNNMRMIFYPAVLGWSIMGWWLSSLKARILGLAEKQTEIENIKTIEISDIKKVQQS